MQHFSSRMLSDQDVTNDEAVALVKAGGKLAGLVSCWPPEGGGTTAYVWAAAGRAARKCSDAAGGVHLLAAPGKQSAHNGGARAGCAPCPTCCCRLLQAIWGGAGLVTLANYGINLRPLLASLGASSIVLGIAAQSLLRNLAAGITLVSGHFCLACTRPPERLLSMPPLKTKGKIEQALGWAKSCCCLGGVQLLGQARQSPNCSLPAQLPQQTSSASHPHPTPAPRQLWSIPPPLPNPPTNPPPALTAQHTSRPFSVGDRVQLHSMEGAHLPNLC